ncbi:MAG TPA: hypothetical protein VIL08_07010 [Limnochorda sp.]
MPSNRRSTGGRKPGSLSRWLRRTQNLLFWTTLLGSAAYAGYRLAARPYRPANHRLALFMGRHLMEVTGPCLAVTTSSLQLERYAGGTLRRLVLAGVSVIVAVVTPSDVPDEEFAVQDDEALEAAYRIGYHRLQMLKVPAPFRSQAVEESLEPLWTEIEPELVVAFDPLDPIANPELAPEQACGQAVLRLAEKLDREHRVKLAFCGTRKPNALVEVTPILSDKIQAVLSHRAELTLPALAVSMGLRLMSRLPDLRGSYEAIRVLEPARRATVWEALAQRAGQEPDEPAPEQKEPRRAVVRTRLPAQAHPKPVPPPTNYWANDGSAPDRIGAIDDDADDLES